MGPNIEEVPIFATTEGKEAEGQQSPDKRSKSSKWKNNWV